MNPYFGLDTNLGKIAAVAVQPLPFQFVTITAWIVNRHQISSTSSNYCSLFVNSGLVMKTVGIPKNLCRLKIASPATISNFE